MSKRRVSTMIAIGALAFAGLAEATTYIVDSLDDTVADDDYSTLREAIQAANTNVAVNEAPAGSATEADEIIFAPALFAGGPATLTLNGTQLEITQDLTLTGPGADKLSIDAAGLSRVMVVEENSAVQLSGLTLTGGYTIGSGGCISNLGKLTLKDSTISENYANYFGGGISNCGELILTDSMLVENVAHRYAGGGINNNGGTAILTASTISGSYGDGIYSNDGGAVTLTDSTVSGNVGHGIHNASDGTLMLIASTVSDNTADYGAGICNTSGAVTLINSMVSGNTAESTSPGNAGNNEGGGIYCHRNGTMMLTNSIVTGNSASLGGGIYNYSNTITLTNSTISGNSASYGGGIFNLLGDTVTLTNSMISGNSAEIEGGGIYDSETFSITDTPTLINTLVALNSAPISADISGTATATRCLIGVNPLLVRNPSAGDDGVWGTADDDFGDPRLQPGSPAIDAGDTTLAVDTSGNPLGTDMRGAPRVFGAAVDIGACEYQDFMSDANGDEAVNINDFILLKLNFGKTTGASKAQGDFNADGAVNISDFNILKQNYGSILTY